MTKFFNAYEKVSHLEMDDLALEIMYEWDEPSTLEAARSNMLSSMNSAKISPQSKCADGKTLGFYLDREMSLPVLLTYQSLGGNLSDCDSHGSTLLFEVLSGFPIFLGNDFDIECIDLLMKQGLDINHTNQLGETPIFGLRKVLKTHDVGRIFATEGHQECFEQRIVDYIAFLRCAQQKGANLRHVDYNGHQIFDMAHGAEFAVLGKHLQIVRAELEKHSILQNVVGSTTVSHRKM